MKGIKRYINLIIMLLTMLVVTSACSIYNEQKESSHTENNMNETNRKGYVSENDEEITINNVEKKENANDSEDQSFDEGTANNSNYQSENTKESRLSKYSSEEIEYARVWLQLGVNQAIDQLYVNQIQAGRPLNPDDETSLEYPETVVQLSGTRLVDGFVTYSSNGDGTVNVYNVPKRWDGKNPAGQAGYKTIIENTKRESIDPNQDAKVEELIKKLKID